MPESIQRFTVFLASPGDVPTERKAVEAAVDEINRTYGEAEDFVITLKRWETHTRPALAPRGGSSQDVIDAQIGAYDIFVGLMWTRFGTPTKKAGSGTEQEYEAARKAGRRKRTHPLRVMFYFRSGTAKLKDIDPDQLKAVRAFRTKLLADLLVRDYETPKEFARLIREHLIGEVRDLMARKRSLARQAKRKKKAAAGTPPASVDSQAPSRSRTSKEVPAKQRTTPVTKPPSASARRTRGPRPLTIESVPKLLTAKDREDYARGILNSLFLTIGRTGADFRRRHEHATLTTKRAGRDAFEVKGQVDGYAAVHFRVVLERDPWNASWRIHLQCAQGASFGGEPFFSTVATVQTADDEYVSKLEDPRNVFRGVDAAPLTAKAVAESFWRPINDALRSRR